MYIYIYIHDFRYFQESLYFSFTPAHFHWVICHATPSAGEVADIPTRACHRGKHNSSGSQPQGAAETSDAGNGLRQDCNWSESTKIVRKKWNNYDS